MPGRVGDRGGKGDKVSSKDENKCININIHIFIYLLAYIQQLMDIHHLSIDQFLQSVNNVIKENGVWILWNDLVT